jgi:hypothetical protein
VDECVRVESSKICESIDACSQELESYTMYGPMIAEARTDLERLKVIITEPSPAGIEEGLDITRKLGTMIGPYSPYVPRVALTIQNVMDWLQAEKTKA